MPVPLPTTEHVVLTPPDAAEAEIDTRGILGAVAPIGGITDVQRMLIEAIVPAMTGHAVDTNVLEPMSARALAEAMARRDLAYRTRVLQIMVLCAFVLRPLPAEVVARLEEFAHELGVDEGMIAVARRFAAGSLGLAAVDFERNGYTSTWHADDAHELHTSQELQSAWETAVHDSQLASRWTALAELPEGTLGRRVSQLYQARGFVVPGVLGSAPPLLAQHDWVHVLADYGTTVESELEVFAFIARANDDMRAFSLLAMVVSLFETGYLRTGAGLFEADTGHLSVGRNMALRVADAMRRGALCRDIVSGAASIDYLRLDWFDLAALPLNEVRARFSVAPKSAAAIAAGAVGPFDAGGISPFQLRSGRAAAARDGRAYDAFGAES